MMFAQIGVVLLLGCAVNAGVISVGVANHGVVDLQTPAKYEFKYGVTDPKTGDQKQQSEVRIGDVVKGEYSLVEPDGTIRIVKYTADDHNGFNAIVQRVGHAAHPAAVLVKKAVVPLVQQNVVGGLGRIGLGALGNSNGGYGLGLGGDIGGYKGGLGIGLGALGNSNGGYGLNLGGEIGGYKGGLGLGGYGGY